MIIEHSCLGTLAAVINRAQDFLKIDYSFISNFTEKSISRSSSDGSRKCCFDCVLCKTNSFFCTKTHVIIYSTQNSCIDPSSIPYHTPWSYL